VSDTIQEAKKEKIQIEKERVAVKKRKEDFMLLTTSTSGMDPRVLATHNFYK
jgi:K+-transporting ATPase c subunit